MTFYGGKKLDCPFKLPRSTADVQHFIEDASTRSEAAFFHFVKEFRRRAILPGVRASADRVAERSSIGRVGALIHLNDALTGLYSNLSSS